MFGRRNLGDKVSIDYDDIVGSGSFKDVYRGRYTKGPRSNQPCVEKRVRPGSMSANELCDSETEINEKALQFVERFNLAGACRMRFYLNLSEVWRTRGDEPCLIEPYIRNFEKYNSNSGWVPNSEAHRVLAAQALSHFSYHISGGQFLLCDLQGGKFNKGIALTDPVVMSNSRRFGPTDLGREGMLAFFSQHRCNQFCDSSWHIPRGRSTTVKTRQGTSAMASTGLMLRAHNPVGRNMLMPAIGEYDGAIPPSPPPSPDSLHLKPICLHVAPCHGLTGKSFRTEP